MTSHSIRFHEITDIQDDLLLPWLDLYELAFPANEKILVSDHLSLLKRRGLGVPEDRHLLAALDGDGGLVGMARYEIKRAEGVGYLFYLAVQAGHRGSGIGREIYAEIVRRVLAQHPSAKALVLEVERPDQAHSVEERANAERRINFYKRQGVCLLDGIRYLQEVPGQPPVLMHVMVHPFHPMDPEEAFELVSRLFTVSRTQSPLSID